MTLRLVRDEPPKRRRKGHRYHVNLIKGDELNRAKQALRNLCYAFGSWQCLADVMKVSPDSIRHALQRNSVTASMMYAASKASGLSIAELLGGPVAADRCRACGQIKRRVA